MSAARADLVAATRRLVAAVGCTAVDADAARDLAARIEALVPMAQAQVGPGVPRTSFEEAVGASTYSWHGLNPALPGIEMRFVEGVAHAELEDGLGHLYEGPAGLVHGGVSAMVMDTMLTSVAQFHGYRIVTASLTTDYRRPVPLDRPLRLSARVEEVSARKVLTSGEVVCAGEVCVQARAVLVCVPGPGE